MIGADPYLQHRGHAWHRRIRSSFSKTASGTLRRLKSPRCLPVTKSSSRQPASVMPWHTGMPGTPAKPLVGASLIAKRHGSHRNARGDFAPRRNPLRQSSAPRALQSERCPCFYCAAACDPVSWCHYSLIKTAHGRHCKLFTKQNKPFHERCSDP